MWNWKRALVGITLGNEHPFMFLEICPREVVDDSSSLEDIVVWSYGLRWLGSTRNLRAGTVFVHSNVAGRARLQLSRRSPRLSTPDYRCRKAQSLIHVATTQQSRLAARLEKMIKTNLPLEYATPAALQIGNLPRHHIHHHVVST